MPRHRRKEFLTGRNPEVGGRSRLPPRFLRPAAAPARCESQMTCPIFETRSSDHQERHVVDRARLRLRPAVTRSRAEVRRRRHRPRRQTPDVSPPGGRAHRGTRVRSSTIERDLSPYREVHCRASGRRLKPRRETVRSVYPCALTVPMKRPVSRRVIGVRTRCGLHALCVAAF